IAAFTTILIAAGAGGIAKWTRHSRVQLSLQKMSIQTLTDSGKATNAAISPDGKFVVYTLVEGERQSLRLKQVATGSEVQLLPRDKVQFLGETFSADGNYIFFVRSDKGNVYWRSLYRMPLLGGFPKQVVGDVETR